MNRSLVIGTLLFLNGLAWLAGSPAGATGTGTGGPYGSTFDFELLAAEHSSAVGSYYRLSTGPGSFTLQFDGIPASLPSYCCGLDTTPSVNESFTTNGDGTSTVEIIATSPNGTDLYPSGMLGQGNVPETDAGLRIGHPHGFFSDSIPLTWDPPHTVLSATVDLKLSNGTSVYGGPVALSPGPFFGAPGPWDGSLAVVFPNQVGKGVTTVDLKIVVPTPDSGGAGCVADTTTLCLSSGRFKVKVAWQALHLGTSGTGQAVPLTSDTGYFWFFGSSNVELVIKVVDGAPVNGHFWVFYGALSNVQYTITVTDTKTGLSKTYFNPQDTLASVADTSAFSASSAAPIKTGAMSVPTASAEELLASAAPRIEPAATAQLASGCTADATTLCLSSGRFKVRVAWRALHLGTSGTGQAVPLTSDTGYFWFFGSSNVELVIKVVDGTPVNGKFWVFFGALSNVNYIVTVTDTQTGFVKAYVNPDGTLASQADTSAMTGSETPVDAIARIPSTLSTLRALVDSLGSSSDGPTKALAARAQAAISGLDQCLGAALQTGLAQCSGYDRETGAAITVAVNAEAAQLAIGLLATATGHENAAPASLRLSRDAASLGPQECQVPVIAALAQEQFCNVLDGHGYSLGVNEGIDNAIFFATFSCVASGGLNVPACAIAETLTAVGLVGKVVEFYTCDFASIIPQAISVQPARITLGPGDNATFDLTLDMAAQQHFAPSLKALANLAINLMFETNSVTRVVLDKIAEDILGAGLDSFNLAPEPACEASAPPLVASANLQPAMGTGISLVDRSVLVDSGAKPGATAKIVPQTKLNIIKTPGVVVVNPVAIFPTSQPFTQTGGSGSVEVTAPIDFSWTAAVDAGYDWITITSGASKPGPGTVRYSVDANNTSRDRTGRMTIAGLTFTVTQPFVSISPPSRSLGAVGDSGSVKLSVPAGYSWIAVPDEVWLTITSGSSGSGPGTVNYSVSTNPKTTQRTGAVTWLEANGPAIATFAVTQAGAAICTYSLTPTNQPFGSSGGPDSVDVAASSGCAWTAAVSSGNNWITITSVSSPSGNGTVNYSVEANPDTTQRTGSITIAGLAFAVIQAGNTASGYYYANWDCHHQSQCIDSVGHDVGSAGPFCSSAGCTAWKKNFFAATCDAQPLYPIYYPPASGSCIN